MIKFDKVNKLLNLDDEEKTNLIYCDTDSLFTTLPVSLEKQTDIAVKYLDELENEINTNELSKFLNKHNIKIREKEDNPLLPQKFKNEYMIKVMILYAKKRYISIIINISDKGDIYYDVDMKGVEGKRATYKYIKDLVNDLIAYLKIIESKKDIYTRYDILDKVLVKYYGLLIETSSKSYMEQIEFFGYPVAVNKNIKDLKNVAGYYKGTIVFDVIAEQFWVNKVGKGTWLRIKIKDDRYVNDILNELSKYKNIKMKTKIDDMIKDITIPDEYLQHDNEILKDIFDIVVIDIDIYFEVLLKKIALLYRPFDITFCDNLLKCNKRSIGANYILIYDDSFYSVKDLT